MLKQKREAKKAQMVDIDGVSTGKLFPVSGTKTCDFLQLLRNVEGWK